MIKTIYLDDNRNYRSDNLIIGKTYENEATRLLFVLDEEMYDKDFYLEFEKPDGTKFSTPRLESKSEVLGDGTTLEITIIKIVEYAIPNSLLDIAGDLKAEVVLRKDDTVFKTYTMKFTILNSINAGEAIPEQYPDIVREIQKIIDSGGVSSDYNTLENKPIAYITGTDETPIYLNQLATGKYIIDGLYMPYKDADISSTGNNTYIEVETTDTEVYLTLSDIVNNNKEHYQIAIDSSTYIRNVISYNNIKHKETITTNSRTTTSTTLQDQVSYQTSGEQTRITLKFPSERDVGFRCWYVFKTGDEVPTFTCDYDIKWHGDGGTDNEFVISTNKYYTIEFWQDVNTFNAEVREV